MTSDRGERRLKVRVKDKRKSQSSRKWLERQLNDPYVAEAKRQGWRSRAVYKLKSRRAPHLRPWRPCVLRPVHRSQSSALH